MFDDKEYIEQLELIRDKLLLSKSELAGQLGISKPAAIYLMDPQSKRKPNYSTKKKIKAFIEKHEGLICQ